MDEQKKYISISWNVLCCVLLELVFVLSVVLLVFSMIFDALNTCMGASMFCTCTVLVVWV